MNQPLVGFIIGFKIGIVTNLSKDINKNPTKFLLQRPVSENGSISGKV